MDKIDIPDFLNRELNPLPPSPITIPAKTESQTRLECSECGAVADAACRCGKPYVPAGTRAAAAIAASPERSDRAIADEIGVGKDTVRRAANQLAHMRRLDFLQR